MAQDYLVPIDSLERLIEPRFDAPRFINIRTSHTVDTEFRPVVRIVTDPKTREVVFSLGASASALNRDRIPWQKLNCEFIGRNSSHSACPLGTSFAEAYGACLAKDKCAVGTVQNPRDPTMCVDPRTGQNVSRQQCVSGFGLTAYGCLPQGPCAPGQALYGQMCIAVVDPIPGAWPTPVNWQGNGYY